MLSCCESIQGRILEVTVVAGQGLKDTEWLSRQDPYVLVKYSGNIYRTRTCTDGGRNPIFRDKFNFKLIEGLLELKILVYNSNTLTADDLIGTGTVYLDEVLKNGYQECFCTLTNNRRSAGEIRLILRYPNAQIPEATPPPPAFQVPPAQYPPYPPPYQAPQPPAYGPYAPPPQTAYPIPPGPLSFLYPPPPSVYPPPPSVYPPPPTAYPPPPSVYPPPPTAYPPPSPYNGWYPPQYYK